MTREQKISRVTAWGAVGNVLLAAAKLVAGVVGRSSAMIADAIHSISDLVSDVVVLVLVHFSSKERDRNHEYGHGKFETLATAIIAFLLIVVGFELLIDAVCDIRLVLMGETLPVPGAIALWAAILSIVVKEILYHWTAIVGRKVNSAAMITNAWHHRTDSLSSIAAAIGIGGAMLMGGKWVVLDPLVGCIISIIIICIAVKMSIPALHELTEGSLPAEEEERIAALILSVEGVKDVHNLKTRRNGPSIIISAHILVDPMMTVVDAHCLTECAEKAILLKYGPETQITIHMEPYMRFF